MRDTVKKFVLSTLSPIRRLQKNCDDLQLRVSELETENLRLKNDMQKLLIVPPEPLLDFNADGMKLWDKNLKSLLVPRFVDAYAHLAKIGVHIEFRAYVVCWAAAHAANIPGDFVECGVNDGWLSLTMCKFIDFNLFNKSLFLFDTYNGIPPEQIEPREAERAALHDYSECYEKTRVKFAPFQNAKLIRGKIPDTLSDVRIDRVAYLSIDMNIAKPERDAIEFFWPKLSPGGVVILDDYAFGGYEAQHEAMDEFAAKVGVSILTLPTGQGLIFKI